MRIPPDLQVLKERERELYHLCNIWWSIIGIALHSQFRRPVQNSHGQLHGYDELRRGLNKCQSPRKIETGYPHGRKGYVVDHVKPLACGGVDAPSNMQWQSK